MRSKASKRKTPVMKKTLNPHYNHTFVYNGVKLEDLQHMCLELTVWDREPLASNDFLGGVRLGVGTGESLSFILTVFKASCVFHSKVPHPLPTKLPCDKSCLLSFRLTFNHYLLSAYCVQA